VEAPFILHALHSQTVFDVLPRRLSCLRLAGTAL